MRANPNRHAGFTLIELMIAVTLGLLVLAALTSFFVRTSYNRSELERNSQQIENGRFAINALRDDMMLAGFYADLNAPPTAVWNTPAACATSGNMGFVPHDPTTSPPPELPVPIFIYPLGAGAPAGCTPDILANTDVIVIRRFNTEPTPVASVVSTQTYVQISECASGPSADNPATPYLVDTGANAANFILRNRNCSAAANLWRYREQLYYVRNYSVNAGDGIPTLVRVELDGGVSNPVPLVEGIENLRVDLGVDTTGDGAPDVWRRCDAATPCTAADYSNVMAAKVYVLSRTLDQSREYTDTKAYQLGVSGSTTATNDHYKRHVYSALIGMPNRSGPREPILAS
jgi:type IV pilus assembly protein PilW